MKKVLLTGATGFIGRHCLQLLLAAGYEVHAVSSRELAQDPGGANWHRVNLLCSRRLAGLLARIKATHLLHLAWYAVPGQYWNSHENIQWVEASLRLVREFVRAGGQRIVVAGTNAEYDWDNGYCVERKTPLRPLTIYGICKHSLQLMLEPLSNEGVFSLAWGRIFDTYGPHEHPNRLVSAVIRALLLGDTARCSHGDQVRDYLHVHDVASAFVSLLESGVQGPVNIASGRPVVLRDLISEIAQKLNQENLVRLGVLPVHANDPPVLVGDVNRLFQEVGWQPEFDLKCGLDQTINWWREQLNVKQGR